MRGRKARGPNIVHDLKHGSDEARRRAEKVLQIIAGELGVEEAAAALHLTPQQMHNLRAQGIEGLIDRLEAQRVGRPPKKVESDEVTALRQEIARLQHELEAARLREEVGLVLGTRTTAKKAAEPKERPPT